MRCATCDSLLTAATAPCLRCSLAGALALGAVPAVAEAEDPVRPFVAGYEPVHELGRGSMGVVWLARDRALDRLVALKLIAAGADPRLGPRLLREGRAIAQLRHPHIVAVHALGDAGGATFLAMDFLAGGDLQTRLKNQLPAPRAAAQLVRSLADALAHAHAAGVLHRDLKPSNILLDESGAPQLADFGLAAPLAGAGDLTARGEVAGTPAYLAPELLGGAARASPASDLYGLGGVLYACLTGRAPFVGASAAAILAQLSGDEPPAPRLLDPAVPRDLETVCLRCLEKNPARRYASAAALRDELDRFLRDEPVRARPVGRPEKIVRWARRKPALATVSALALALLLTLAIGGPAAAWRIERARVAAEVAGADARAAEARTREQLRAALLARSQATRLTGRMGQRRDALAAAGEAARIRPGVDARNEVIAALALPDFTELRAWPLRTNPQDAATFDPDHDRYVVEAPGRGFALHRLSDGLQLRLLTGPVARSRSGPTFSPDGHFLVIRDAQDRLVVWRDDRDAAVFMLEGRRYLLGNNVGRYGQPDAFSPDGATLASALPGGVSLHATTDGRELGRLPAEAEPSHVAWSPDGTLVAIGRGLVGRDGGAFFLRILDARSGAEISRLPLTTGFQSLAWSPDSTALLIAGQRLELYEVRTSRLRRTLSDPRAMRGLFGPEGTLLSATQSGVVTLWDPATARPMLSGNLGGQPEIAIDRAGHRLVKASPDAARLYAIELSPVVTAIPPRSPEGFDNVTNHGGGAIDYSDDGQWIATAVWGAVHLREAATGRVIAGRMLGTSNNHAGVRFARDQRSLLTGSRELGLVRFPLLLESGQPPRLGPPETIDDEKDFVLADLSRDGRRAALVSMWRNEVKVVALAAPAPAARWPLPGAGRAVFLADDREVLANSTSDMGKAALSLHDTVTGQALRALPESRGYHVRTSGDGRWVVLGTSLKESALRRAHDWTPGPALPADFQGAGKNAVFTRDGTLLAIAAGGVVGLVRTTDGELLAHLETTRSGSYVPELAFSPDGGQLALCWENGLLTLWDLRTLRRELAARGLDW
ncbi:MAG: protein kinase [Burkholderiales bacterium]|nr:protein kinase [Burkholderiales bacterium]